MGLFEVQLPEVSPCDQCGHELALEVQVCPDCGSNTCRINFKDFYGDLERFRMMDARYGGLVLGRDDAADDIPLFICRYNGVFTLVGMMQGGEYILSRAATRKHDKRLHILNAETGEAGIIAFPLGTTSSVINTNFMPRYGGLWITEEQFIVNRYATKTHFDELERMNSSSNYELAKLLDEEQANSENL